MSAVRGLRLRLGRRVVRTLGLRRVGTRRVTASTPLFNRKLKLSSVSTLRVALLLRGRCNVQLTGPTRTGPVFRSITALTSCVHGGHG